MSWLSQSSPCCRVRCRPYLPWFSPVFLLKARTERALPPRLGQQQPNLLGIVWQKRCRGWSESPCKEWSVLRLALEAINGQGKSVSKWVRTVALFDHEYYESWWLLSGWGVVISTRCTNRVDKEANSFQLNPMDGATKAPAISLQKLKHQLWTSVYRDEVACG